MESCTRGRLLGRGSSATVSLATSSSTGELFAVKSAPLPNSHHLQTEQTILSSIPPSPYIVTYKGHHTTTTTPSTTFNIFMEYLPRGSLSDEIARRRGGTLFKFHDNHLLQLYTWRILKGLHHLHSTAGVVHCDIKPANILIGPSGPKIADFGCARSITNVSSLTPPFSGTPLYMAPEVGRGENQGPSSDIWSFGCTLLEMVTGTPPWTVTGADPVSFLYRLGYGLLGETPNLPELMSEEGKDFIDKCLRRRPQERWTTTMLLHHPFVRRFETTSEGIEFDSDSNGVEEMNNNNNNNNNNNICCSTSPTSVLQQQGTWSSECEFDDQRERTVEDRIRGLVESSSVLVEMREWEFDEDWITVRNRGR